MEAARRRIPRGGQGTSGHRALANSSCRNILAAHGQGDDGKEAGMNEGAGRKASWEGWGSDRWEEAWTSFMQQSRFLCSACKGPRLLIDA